MNLPRHRSTIRCFARLERGYAVVRLLSLDIAMAGLAGGVLATRALHTTPRPAFFLVLPLSVWVVYSLDHLLDAGRMRSASTTPRHRFHFVHQRVLWMLCMAAAILAGGLALVELSWTGVIFGIVIASLVFVHELIVKIAGAMASPLLAKELGVAVIFTFGTWGLPLVWRCRLLGFPSVSMWLMLLQYLLLALANLVIFAIFDEAADTAGGQTSFVRGVGRRNAAGVVGLALLLGGALAVPVLQRDHSSLTIGIEWNYGIMAGGLSLTRMAADWFGKAERFRTLGDGVFLLPLLLVFLS